MRLLAREVLAVFEPQEATAIIVGLIALIGIILGIAVPLWRNGRDARDNAVEARHAASAVRVQMEPNGGGSLRDVVDRLLEGQERIGALADRLAVTADRVDLRTLMLDQRLNATAADLDHRLKAIERQMQP